MALSIDIKPAKEFANSLEYAADAMDRVASIESKVNGITKQLGSSAKFAAGEYKKLAGSAASITKIAKRTTDETEKQNKVEKKIAKRKAKGFRLS